MHVTMVHAAAGQGGLFYCGWEGCSRGHRGFNARYKMLVHVRTHTNEKPHRCAQCDKSFSRAENLKIHARSHTGERPYTCPVPGCNKAYSNSSDRFKHTRTHAVDKPYVCKVEGCPKRYTDPSSLRKHVKTYRHFPGAVASPQASPQGSPHGSQSPLRSPASPRSPSSDEEQSRSAFRPVVSASPESFSPASLERPPLPGEYRGIPIKKAISARVRRDLDASSMSDYEHVTDGSLSPPLATPLVAPSGGLALNHQRSWAGGSVWVSGSLAGSLAGSMRGSLAGSLSGAASPDTLSPSSSPSAADWFPPMYSSHAPGSAMSPVSMPVPVPVVPWGLSLWSFPTREDVPRGAHNNHHHTIKLEDQSVPLDLTVTRH